TPIDSTDETLIATTPIATTTPKSNQDLSDKNDKNLSDQDTNSKPLQLKTLKAPNFVSVTKNLRDTEPIGFFGYGPSQNYLGNGNDYDLHVSNCANYDSTDPISPSVQDTV
ncbi:hypothetical protein NEAUS04_2384, partial [Nematocida ausubeli]